MINAHACCYSQMKNSQTNKTTAATGSQWISKWIWHQSTVLARKNDSRTSMMFRFCHVLFSLCHNTSSVNGIVSKNVCMLSSNSLANLATVLQKRYNTIHAHETSSGCHVYRHQINNCKLNRMYWANEHDDDCFVREFIAGSDRECKHIHTQTEKQNDDDDIINKLRCPRTGWCWWCGQLAHSKVHGRADVVSAWSKSAIFDAFSEPRYGHALTARISTRLLTTATTIYTNWSQRRC